MRAGDCQLPFPPPPFTPPGENLKLRYAGVGKTMSRLSLLKLIKNNHHERRLFAAKHHCNNIDIQDPEVFFFFCLAVLGNPLPSLIAMSLKDKKSDREKERQI